MICEIVNYSLNNYLCDLTNPSFEKLGIMLKCFPWNPNWSFHDIKT